jgi:hypothetical protein
MGQEAHRAGLLNLRAVGEVVELSFPLLADFQGQAIMSAIDRLLSNYARQVRLPWSANTSGKQRVWFAVYPPAEERRVRARLPQFEALTLEANHGWTTIDLTDLLPNGFPVMNTGRAIFSEPEQFSANSELEDLAVERVRQAAPVRMSMPPASWPSWDWRPCSTSCASPA